MLAFFTERPDKSFIGWLGKLNAKREGISGWIVCDQVPLVDLEYLIPLESRGQGIPCPQSGCFLMKDVDSIYLSLSQCQRLFGLAGWKSQAFDCSAGDNL